ncbi:DJ-1 family glyoxalase III [Serpentinicella alkaliphila]|uniref:4-methyl-5(B-hydroxyethyl)-thiazole monophosphate biosynthesis n=1 Tax=Serpentinicella alkaliphila TaxID=1734049 RepID=A0A4R2TLC0_9FIRM|nr:DJ-1 family glyoxalase III [Serpentinicella alkaliphila]QUH26478.1 DJ-1/PfpI family protein [Serpentinicella alkaliphila]TCQ03242.1 4-methyl-5(b-hydroxyethyl)-thiazole monophosphate biosynthesis [Serpentinicella alkaliphila]
MKSILLLMADGFEEIEGITCIDVLRRGGINVVTASLDNLDVCGSHNIIVKADKPINDIDISQFDGVVLPGGMPGSANLRDNEKVIKIVKEMNEMGGLIAAICAAPIVLERAGVIEGKNATSYPGFNNEMGSCTYLEDRVVLDNNILTARGPGVAMEFSFAIVEYLINISKVDELKIGMIV